MFLIFIVGNEAEEDCADEGKHHAQTDLESRPGVFEKGTGGAHSGENGDEVAEFRGDVLGECEYECYKVEYGNGHEELFDIAVS